MAVRWRRYFQQCKGKRSEGDRYGKVITKGVECEGKRGKHCPEGVPGTCGAWAIEFRDQHGIWKGVIKPGFTKTQAKEAYNEIVRNIQRGLFDLPMLRKMQKDNVKPSTVNQCCSILRLILDMIDFINSMITLISQKTGRVISLPLSSYLITELKKYKASVCNEKECLFYDGEINHQTEVRFSTHFIKVFRGLQAVRELVF